MPDPPTDRAVGHEPLPSARPRPAGRTPCTSVLGSGAPAEVAGRHWHGTSPRDRGRWRAFACAAHADRSTGAVWCDVGALDDDAAAELADRRDRWAAALAGKDWRPPQPMEPRGR